MPSVVAPSPQTTTGQKILNAVLAYLRRFGRLSERSRGDRSRALDRPRIEWTLGSRRANRIPVAGVRLRQDPRTRTNGDACPDPVQAVNVSPPTCSARCRRTQIILPTILFDEIDGLRPEGEGKRGSARAHQCWSPSRCHCPDAALYAAKAWNWRNCPPTLPVAVAGVGDFCRTPSSRARSSSVCESARQQRPSNPTDLGYTLRPATSCAILLPVPGPSDLRCPVADDA